MQERAKITIVVTVYNKESSIRRCLTSLLKQNTNKFELIVIDDGSSDNSLSICKDVLKNRLGVSIIQQKHQGVSKARNIGLELANTEYIMFLDGDDWLEKNTISKLLSVIEYKNIELVVFGFYRQLNQQKLYPVCFKDEVFFEKKDILENFTHLWSSGLFYSVCNKLFYLPLIKNNNISFNKLDFGEDFEFSRNILKICSCMKILNECFYHYTSNINGSLSSIYRENLFSIRLKEHYEMIKYFVDLNCYDDDAQEFLSRRHIERVIGCIENVCSPDNKNPIYIKLNQIKEILDDNNTYNCAIKSKITSKKMKILIKPIINKQYIVCLLFGYIMSFCKNHIPNLFINLKMNR